ncbi:MAG: 30S ribosome-binding factor RbfA [Verrucomicrobiales bacterium]|nr:30S ribosome-binding factor RbfA [Verrucomicrobiales bacterium]
MQRVRYERVRELLKRELGEIVRRQIPLQTGGIISVNDVGLARDLHSAKVFVSIIGTSEQRKQGEELLKLNAVAIQHQLGQSVVLRYTPHLQFVVDDSIERGDRVLGILEDLERDGGGDPKP